MIENNPKYKKKLSSELSGIMMNQIIDESLMQRYGTSLSINMGREYQQYLEEKYVKLNKEFEKINLDLDEGSDSYELTSNLPKYIRTVLRMYYDDTLNLIRRY